MNTNSESERKEAARISRRSMLGKSAKYAALIPVSTLVATKASAHVFSGLSTDCAAAFNGQDPQLHCDTGPNHTFTDPV